MKNGIPNDEEFNDYFAPDADLKLATWEKVLIGFFLLVVTAGIVLYIIYK